MGAHNITLETPVQREAFFVQLYEKAFPAIAHYIARKGGNLEEAQDIFQDTLVIYYEKRVSAQAGVIVNEKAYLLGIAKNLWSQHFKTGLKNQPLDGFDTEAVPEEQLATGKLLHYLETSGKKCMELLKAYYYDHLQVDSIARLFGYSGIHSATVAKYKCLEKVRDTVKQKSLRYADFIK